jgi:hypothetical protein
MEEVDAPPGHVCLDSSASEEAAAAPVGAPTLCCPWELGRAAEEDGKEGEENIVKNLGSWVGGIKNMSGGP